jgi:hypothetical protein
MFHPPGECPACGAMVHRGARACPDCGADDRSGWRDDAAHDGLDLPDGSFDYAAFVREEFGRGPARPRGVAPLWWITGLVLVVLLVWYLL